MKVWHVLVPGMLKRAGKWLVAAQKGPFRFRLVDVVLWWVLVSLVAISVIAEHPLVALTAAIAGGTMIGVLCVVGSDSF
jgi:hypothetical protein